MFDYIKGIIGAKSSLNNVNTLTVEAGGIGYLVNLTSRDYAKLGVIETVIKVYLVLQHREDSMTLCGFLQKEDRDIFKILTSVSGVGPKMALLLLDEFESFEIISTVIKGDYKELTRAKGVGPKLAQKMILELKDKLINMQKTMPIEIDSKVEIEDEAGIEDAQRVLISLGYEREEIKLAITKSLVYVKDSSNPEEILKETLKILSE